MIQKNLNTFEMLFVWCTTDKGILKKSVLDMEFGKWQIKIKTHGLGHTIPCKSRHFQNKGIKDMEFE